MNTDTFMCSSDEKRPAARCRCIRNTSGWRLSFATAYHAHQPLAWSGRSECAFRGDVEYLINNEKVNINQGHISCSGPVHRTN